ncbi:MAG: AAA family ATPase [Planctomycetota bacterium]
MNSLFAEEEFLPHEPTSLEETGVSRVFIETLVVKLLLQVGSAAGRDVAKRVCLPFGLLEPLLSDLRSRQLLFHERSAPLNDYCYALTDAGRERAASAMRSSSYVGPVPVPLDDYILSVEAQTIRAEAARREQLLDAFADISVEADLLDVLGPAVNSGAGLFLYGAPGNGKTTLAQRITGCFGRNIWLPHALIEGGQVIKLYDTAIHTPAAGEEESADGDDTLLSAAGVDPRWIKVRRPTAVVGGELTMDNLEIRHDPVANVSEASLQLKSNCGCLLIDDFGRQRVEPTDLLNRWIIPLENRCDYLTLAGGKKIRVPFDQLIIFSTNLEPTDLADEAFLRRIPYKVEVTDPSVEEFRSLFRAACDRLGCAYRAEAVDYLLQKHYAPRSMPLRRCHARDLLMQVRNYCAYQGLPLELRPDYLDRAVGAYFTALGGEVPKPPSAAPAEAARPTPPPIASTPPPADGSTADRDSRVMPIATAAVPVTIEPAIALPVG